MINKKGFTLTEILLAIMIVGIIGVALVSLTTAASRESGVGRSKIMLRNSLSLGLRQIRHDIQRAHRVLYVRGPIGTISEGRGPIPLLMLVEGLGLDNQPVGNEGVRSIRYCFYPGTVTQQANGGALLPGGARDGGTITRVEDSIFPDDDGNYTLPITDGVPNCPESDNDTRTIVLHHVKYIHSDAMIPLANDMFRYPVPLFQIDDGCINDQDLPCQQNPYSAETLTNETRQSLGSQLRVRLILETPSSPVVNEVAEETFFVPNGVVQWQRPAN